MAALRSLTPDDPEAAAELLAAEVHLARLKQNLARTEGEPVWYGKVAEQVRVAERWVERLKGQA